MKLRHIKNSVSGCRRKTYTDRLLLAHFAIITFGLVATLGNWSDSVTRFSVVCGMSATLCVMCYGMDRRFIRGALALWRGDSFFFIGPVREGSVSHETLDYIRHANLLAGAPPALFSNNRIYLQGGLLRQMPAASLLRLFPFNPFLSSVRRNSCHQSQPASQ